MTLRMRTGLVALSFSIACWSAVIAAAVSALEGGNANADQIATASTMATGRL